MGTSTIKSSGGDYTSLSAWEAAKNGNIIGLGPEIAECYDLDDFRHVWGKPVRITKALGGIGRRDGIANKSYHNIDRWGYVRAVDVMPEGMDNPSAAMCAINLAEHVGFRGIGLYPHWKPSPGLHLDNRSTALVTWGAARKKDKQVYVTLDEALALYK